MARLDPIWIFHSDPVVETIETVFPCSRILYLCFESLGLDITSVILNPLKMAATYLFLWFLSVKESYEPKIDSRVIHFWSKDFYQFQQIFLLDLKLARIGSFRFLYRRYTYEVVPTYWLVLTLDPCPEKWINTFYSSSIMYYLFTLQPNKKWGF